MKKSTIAVCVMAALLPLQVLADNEERSFTPEKVTLGISLGSLSGETKERVYRPSEGGRRVSQLNWKYDNAAIVKGSFDWDLMPRVSLGLSGWTTLASTDGKMDDYDWQLASQKHWTDHSRHPNTDLKYANEYDINIKGWILNQPTWRLGLMAGYQESRYSFMAKGGSFNYENGADVGEFPADTKVISYKQRFKLPYIGLVGNYRHGNFEAGGSMKYSGWVDSTDHDEHYLTYSTFKADVNQQDFYSLSANLGYHLTEHSKLYVEGVWGRIMNKKGDLHVIDHEEGDEGTLKKGAGIESYNYMLTLGWKYAF